MNGTRHSILTIMQTRRGSSRLPDKVLRPLLGRPLFVRQAERIQASRLYGSLVVATTHEKADDRVREICGQYGLDCFPGEPLDVLDRHYRAACRYEATIVVKIPSDCPLIDPVVIDRVIGHYLEREGEYDYVSNLHPATYPDGNDVEVMSFSALERAWKNATRPFEREHTTPYLWERPAEFRIGNIGMEGGDDLSMHHRFTIDYEEDYAFIRSVFEALYPVNPLFGLEDILRLLEERPDLFLINHQWAGVNWYRKHLDELKTITADKTKILERGL
ncbi:MAG: glycosyltransferase family protein [Puia sp.]|nr:glycosyltransferase family protein [Puia sp.]